MEQPVSVSIALSLTKSDTNNLLQNDVKCPQCQSDNFKKAGVRQERQKYQCKDCGKQFIENPQAKVGHEGIECPRCGGDAITKSGKDCATNQKQRYRCKDCKKNFVINPSFIQSRNILLPTIKPEEMFELDIWDIRVLGIQSATANGRYSFNFEKIQPEWLRYAVKKWIWNRAAKDDKASTLNGKLNAINEFLRFVQSKIRYFQPHDINRSLIIDYLISLKGKKYTSGTRINYISSLKQFLEECQRFSWAAIPKEPLVFAEDFPKKERRLPRFLPDEIIKQLEDNLNALPKPVQRQVKLLQGTGVRISELCNLKFNCLRENSTGGYWLNIYQLKMRKEISICISRELAEIIQEQQQYIGNNLGSNFNYLFCETSNRSSFSLGKHTKRSVYIKNRELDYFEPIAQKLHPETVRGYLHRLAQERKIQDTTGKVFPLGKVHQFRHTHGTELINNGVPQHIVQKRLGHASPEMTSVYAHIHDKTMKQKMEEFWDGRVVNNKGEVVVPENPDLDTAQMQWIKKNMKAQTLADGFCGLPVTKTCPVQGSPCLTCSHLRTTIEFLDVHKKRLKETEKLIENARANGWDRQVETNLPIAENLRKIIRGLEQKEVVYGDESFPEQEVGEPRA